MLIGLALLPLFPPVKWFDLTGIAARSRGMKSPTYDPRVRRESSP